MFLVYFILLDPWYRESLRAATLSMCYNAQSSAISSNHCDELGGLAATNEALVIGYLGKQGVWEIGTFSSISIGIKSRAILQFSDRNFMIKSQRRRWQYQHVTLDKHARLLNCVHIEDRTLKRNLPAGLYLRTPRRCPWVGHWLLLCYQPTIWTLWNSAYYRFWAANSRIAKTNLQCLFDMFDTLTSLRSLVQLAQIN